MVTGHASASTQIFPAKFHSSRPLTQGARPIESEMTPTIRAHEVHKETARRPSSGRFKNHDAVTRKAVSPDPFPGSRILSD